MEDTNKVFKVIGAPLGIEKIVFNQINASMLCVGFTMVFSGIDFKVKSIKTHVGIVGGASTVGYADNETIIELEQGDSK